MMKDKKCIFFTGATGFLGSRLILRFVNSGYQLKLLVRAKNKDSYSRVVQCLSKFYNNLSELSEVMKNIEVLDGDVVQKNLGLTEDTVKALSKEITDVFHCAAAVSFDEEKEDVVRRNNIEGAKNILSFAKKLHKAHFHYMSTAYVCGQREGLVKEDELDVKQKFNNAYESSKCEAECLVRKFTAQHKINATIYRPSIIVGDSRTAEALSSFGVYGILRAVDIGMRRLKSAYRKGNRYLKRVGVKFNDDNFFIPLRALGNRNKSLNIVTIDYASEAIIRIFKNKHNVGKTYHITNSHPLEMGLLKDCLCETLKITGTKFLSQEDFNKEPMKPWERLFNKGIKVYTPYLLLNEPQFSDANTQMVLRNTGVKQAPLDRRLMMKLLSYSYSTNYGKKRK